MFHSDGSISKVFSLDVIESYLLTVNQQTGIVTTTDVFVTFMLAIDQQVACVMKEGSSVEWIDSIIFSSSWFLF